MVDDGEKVALYRAVAHEEAHDIRSSGRFRLGPGSAYFEGKWFARSFDDAVRWGQRMPPVAPRRPFLVAQVRASAAVVGGCLSFARLDGIGPAVFVLMEDLQLVNAAGVISLIEVDPKEQS